MLLVEERILSSRQLRPVHTLLQEIVREMLDSAHMVFRRASPEEVRRLSIDIGLLHGQAISQNPSANQVCCVQVEVLRKCSVGVINGTPHRRRTVYWYMISCILLECRCVIVKKAQ